MALAEQEVLSNKDEFITLLKSIKRENALIAELIEKLENSDFFVAPASTKYHSNFEGGLCQHSLNVYYNLLHLVEKKQGLDAACYDDDSLKIVGLLHDISKMNTYERYVKNNKVYKPDGKQYDNIGRYEWIPSMEWKRKEKTFVYGSHECTSEFITRQYIPLTLDESVAILHHMGSMSWDSAKDNIGEVFNQYPLALMLYMADMMSSYIDEGTRNE